MLTVSEHIEPQNMISSRSKTGNRSSSDGVSGGDGGGVCVVESDVLASTPQAQAAAEAAAAVSRDPGMEQGVWVCVYGGCWDMVRMDL
jgi:hypothetical protein